MANERLPDDLTRPPFAGDDLRDPTRLDNRLQPDPELAEGPAGRGRIAIFAAGIAVVLAAVFYGLNSSSVQQAGTAPVTTAQDNTQPPPAPPGMRDVTPHANTAPGVTTGSAANRPPPSPDPSDTNQAANPFNRSERR